MHGICFMQFDVPFVIMQLKCGVFLAGALSESLMEGSFYNIENNTEDEELKVFYF